MKKGKDILNVKNIRNGINIKKLACLCLTVMMLLMSLSGCQKKETITKLSVYYVKGATQQVDIYKDVLEMYDSLNKNTELNCVVFETEDSLKERVASEMATGKGPDVILLTSATTIDVYKSINGDNFADLSSYFEKDTNYSVEEYFDNVIKGAQVNGKQYIVPLTFDMNVYGMKKSVMDQLQVDKSDRDLNFNDFMNKILEYQQKLDTAENTNVTLSAIRMYSSDSLLRDMIRICGLKVVDENKSICMTKKDFQSFINVIKVMQEETLEKIEAIKLKGQGLQMFGNYDTFFFDTTNVPFVLSLFNGMLASKFNDSIVFQGIPNSSENGAYNATIERYGVVNSNSKKVKYCYSLLRYLMDYNSTSAFENNTLSINKRVYSNIIEKIKIGNKTYPLSAEESYKTIRWDETMIESYNYMVDHIKTVSINNIKVENIIESSMQGCLKGTEDFDSCYDKMINQLNLYLKE